MQISDLKEIAPLIGGLIAAGATLIAVIVTSAFNLRLAKLNVDAQGKQKAKELKIQKIEEMFFLFEKWQINVTSIYIIYYRCYLGKITHSDAIELSSKNNSLAPGDAQRYKILMEIYFPLLSQEYQAVDDARKGVAPFLSDPDATKLSAKDFLNYQVRFEKECEIFKSKIRATAHQIIA